MTDEKGKQGERPPGAVPGCDRVALERRSWFSRMARACDLFDAMPSSERRSSGLPSGKQPIDLLGKALWVAFALVVLSGVGLLAGYRPTVSGALSSVEYIQTSMPAGWWLRGVHKYACDLFVILAAIRLFRIAYRRAYRRGGGFTWIAALGFLAFGMISGLTGYLLVWNQRAFFSGRLLGAAAQRFEEAYPLGGLGLEGWLSRVLLGGESISQSFLTIVLALHIALSVVVLLVVLRWRLAPRYQSPRHRAFEPAIPRGLVWLILIGLSVLALLIPPPLGTSADRLLAPRPIISDWYFLAFYHFFRFVTPASAITVMSIGLVIAIFLPWLDRSRKRGPRPGVLALICAAALTWLILTLSMATGERAGAAVVGVSAIVWLAALGLGLWGEMRGARNGSQPSEPEVSDT